VRACFCCSVFVVSKVRVFKGVVCGDGVAKKRGSRGKKKGILVFFGGDFRKRTSLRGVGD